SPMPPRPPPSTLFPYTTLFRSDLDGCGIGLRIRHPAAHVRIEREVEGAQQHLALARARHGHLVEQVVLLGGRAHGTGIQADPVVDRKSTRLNSSHVSISYAVFC